MDKPSKQSSNTLNSPYGSVEDALHGENLLLTDTEDERAKKFDKTTPFQITQNQPSMLSENDRNVSDYSHENESLLMEYSDLESFQTIPRKPAQYYNIPSSPRRKIPKNDLPFSSSYQNEDRNRYSNSNTNTVAQNSSGASCTLIVIILFCFAAIIMGVFQHVNPNSHFHFFHHTTSSHINTIYPQQPGKATAKFVPFTTVYRGLDANSIKASDIVFPDLFHHSLVYSPSNYVSSNNDDTIKTGASTTNDGDTRHLSSLLAPPKSTIDNSTDSSLSAGPLLNIPLPTGAFWMNLVIEPTPENGLSYPIMVYPYGYKWSPSLLQVSYPPVRRLVDDISIRDIFNPDLTFGTEETISKRNVVKFDPLSVTLRFYADSMTDSNIQNDNVYDAFNTIDDDIDATADDDATFTTTNNSSSSSIKSFWETYLVQGSPYVTHRYVDMTPILTPLSIYKGFACPRDEEGNYKDKVSSQDLAVIESTRPFATNNEKHTMFGICSEIVSSDVKKNPQDIVLTGVQFLIRTQEDLTWMLFASEPITLIMDGASRRSIKSTEKFTGILRVALIPPTTSSHDTNSQAATSTPASDHMQTLKLSSSSAVKRLIYHSHVYPIGASIDWTFENDHEFNKDNWKDLFSGSSDPSSYGNVKFTYETRSTQYSTHSNPGLWEKDLLMLGLPHHAQLLPSSMILQDFDATYRCIKGTMTAVVGHQWSYDELLTNVEFDFETTIQKAKKLSKGVKTLILSQIQEDLTRVLPTLDENIYGFGKQVARLAQLAYIASILEPREESADNISEYYGMHLGPIAMSAAKMLHTYLVDVLTSKNSDVLVYDISFGGIITKNGFQDSMEDFGNGWYNDHHFHYGYLLYACAIMGKLNTTFVDEYKLHVDSILFDVAYGSNVDSKETSSTFFPLTRHKSWFDGHSFASGLFPFANGKSQESSSEAINCYYGAYLWSLVRATNDVDFGISRVNFAKLLLAMEIRGAKTYWHMIPNNVKMDTQNMISKAIYDESFSESYMVGNLGMMDVTSTTWFGTKKLYTHMINFMPVTAITRELFDVAYVEEEFKNIIQPVYNDVEMAWRGYVIADHAITSPNQAWKDAQELRSYELDSALSQSQVYYWISTFPTFNSSVGVISSGQNNSTSTNNSGDYLSGCLAHSKCAQLGLTGLCCPTANGLSLDCCSN